MNGSNNEEKWEPCYCVSYLLCGLLMTSRIPLLYHLSQFMVLSPLIVLLLCCYNSIRSELDPSE